MLSSSKLSRQLTATLAELDGARSNITQLQTRVGNVEEQLRRERARTKQLAEENDQLQDVITALRSLVSDKSAQLEATKTALEEERRMTASLCDDHIRLMEESYTPAKQRPWEAASDTASFVTAISRTPSPASLKTESRASSMVSVTSSAPRASDTGNLFSLAFGRALIAVEISRGSEGSLGFSFACQSITTETLTTQGVFVKAVRPGSSAEQCLVPGDEIVELERLPCRGLPQPVISAKLRSLQTSVCVVVARSLQQCGLSAQGTPSHLPAFSDMPPKSAVLPIAQPALNSAFDMSEFRLQVHEEMQNMVEDLWLRISASEEQVRGEIAVCNRAMISVQMLVEEAMTSRPTTDPPEALTPTGSVEDLSKTGATENGESREIATPPSSPLGKQLTRRLSTIEHQLQNLLSDGNTPDGKPRRRISEGPSASQERVLDELLREKQRVSEQQQVNTELQMTIAALRAECSTAQHRVRQAEGMVETLQKASEDTAQHTKELQGTCANLARQVAEATTQLGQRSTELAEARAALTAKEETVSKLLANEAEWQTNVSAAKDEQTKHQQEVLEARDELTKVRAQCEQLAAQCKQEASAMEKLQEQLSHTQDELLQAQLRATTSEAKVTQMSLREEELRRSAAESELKLEHVNKQQQDDSQQIVKLQEQLRHSEAARKTEVDTLQRQVANGEKQLSSVQLKLDSLQATDHKRSQEAVKQTEELSRQVESQREASERIRQEFNDCQQALLAAQHEKHQLQLDLTRLQGEYRNTHDLLEATRATQKSLAGDCETARQEAVGLRAQVKDLTERLEERDTAATSLGEEVTALSKARQQLDVDLRNTNARLEKKEKRLRELDEQVAALTSRCESAEKNLEQAAAQQADAEEDQAKYRQLQDSVKSMEAQHQKEVESLRKELKDSSSAAHDRQGEVSDAKLTIQQLNGSLDMQRQREQQLTAQLTELSEAHKKLKNEHQQETGQRQVLEQEVERLQQSFLSLTEVSKTATTSADERLRQVELQLQDERKQTLAAHSELAQLQSHSKQTDEQLSKCKARLDAAQNENTLLKETSELLKAACQQSDAQQQAEAQKSKQLEKDLRAARSTLEATTAMSDQLRAMLSQQETQLASVDVEKKHLEERLAKTEGKTTRRKGELENLRRESERLTSQLQQAQQQLELQSGDVQSLSSQLAKESQARQDSDEMRRQLEAKMEQYQHSMKQSNETKRSLEEQLSELAKTSSEKVP